MEKKIRKNSEKNQKKKPEKKKGLLHPIPPPQTLNLFLFNPPKRDLSLLAAEEAPQQFVAVAQQLQPRLLRLLLPLQTRVQLLQELLGMGQGQKNPKFHTLRVFSGIFWGFWEVSECHKVIKIIFSGFWDAWISSRTS